MDECDHVTLVCFAYSCKKSVRINVIIKIIKILSFFKKKIVLQLASCICNIKFQFYYKYNNVNVFNVAMYISKHKQFILYVEGNIKCSL
jgi:hypothetical protein